MEKKKILLVAVILGVCWLVVTFYLNLTDNGSNIPLSNIPHTTLTTNIQTAHSAQRNIFTVVTSLQTIVPNISLSGFQLYQLSFSPKGG
jgi:hypothetical protein